ncbi:CoA transferase, partial [Frankia sp. R82]|nr:CoA transferase [Frankia sp. R82]
MPTSLDRRLFDELCAALVGQGLSVPIAASASSPSPSPAPSSLPRAVAAPWAATAAWADSGLMWLTGAPQAPPTLPDGPVIGRAEAAARLFTALSAEVGRTTRPEVAALLGGRAALLGLARGGTCSAGGSCRLLPTADGWIAVNLARAHDEDAVDALLGALGGGVGGTVRERAWAELATAVSTRPAAEVVGFARLLAMPVAALDPGRPLIGSLVFVLVRQRPLSSWKRCAG